MILIIDSENAGPFDPSELLELATAVIDEDSGEVVKDRELRCSIRDGVAHFILHNVEGLLHLPEGAASTAD